MKNLIKILGLGIAIGVATIVSGCGVKYTTNTARDLKRPAITERDARYSVESFTTKGKRYEIIKDKRWLLPNGEVYEGPAIAIYGDSKDVIDDKRKTMTLESDKYFAIVPVDCEEEQLYLADKKSKKREAAIFNGAKIKAKNVPQGFNILTRDNHENPFTLSNINIQKSRTYVFRDETPVYKTNALNDEIESLPIGLMPLIEHQRVVDRKRGEIGLRGFLYKAILAKEAPAIKIEPAPAPKKPVEEITDINETTKIEELEVTVGQAFELKPEVTIIKLEPVKSPKPRLKAKGFEPEKPIPEARLVPVKKPATIDYTVKPNDSLWKISEDNCLCTNLNELIELNPGMTKKTIIHPGDTIKVRNKCEE